MTSYQKIREACKSLKLPSYPDFNTADEETYVVYNTVNEMPDNFGDDAPSDVVVDLQAHLYIPAHQNFFEIKSKLAKALFEQGFTYPSIPLNAVEDEKVRHIVFEFEDDVSI